MCTSMETGVSISAHDRDGERMEGDCQDARFRRADWARPGGSYYTSLLSGELSTHRRRRPFFDHYTDPDRQLG